MSNNRCLRKIPMSLGNHIFLFSYYLEFLVMNLTLTFTWRSFYFLNIFCKVNLLGWTVLGGSGFLDILHLPQTGNNIQNTAHSCLVLYAVTGSTQIALQDFKIMMLKMRIKLTFSLNT